MVGIFPHTNVFLEIPYDCNGGIQSDLKLFQSIIQNLIENSNKYQDYYKENCPLRIRLENHNTFIAFITEDNGIGIPSEFQKDIFDMF